MSKKLFGANSKSFSFYITGDEHFRVREQMHCSWRTFPRLRTAGTVVVNVSAFANRGTVRGEHVRFVRERFLHIPNTKCCRVFILWLSQPVSATSAKIMFLSEIRNICGLAKRVCRSVVTRMEEVQLAFTGMLVAAREDDSEDEEGTSDEEMEE